MSGKRQKNQLELAFADEGRSEAPRASEEGTESLAGKRRAQSPAQSEKGMEENCKRALVRVKATRGVREWTG